MIISVFENVDIEETDKLASREKGTVRKEITS
jgi:hypothetical protein